MGDMAPGLSTVPPDLAERQSLCFSQPKPGVVVHSGDEGFAQELLRHYTPAESNAAEAFVTLKHALRSADTESFWHLLTEGLANVTGAQYAFVSKRILQNDRNVAVELPPLGEPGACLMGAAFYVSDGKGNAKHMSNFKYHAYQCPCAYMKHDKIFIIPEKLSDFIINNLNELSVPGEAYLGIPLFADGKCFAHFGVMWSPEGAAQRRLGWGFLEMLFHGLEDLILQRVLEGRGFAGRAEQVREERGVVPHEAVSMAQSLKPYARSLSHELRTPMQGVVGTLDVMMASVKEVGEDTQHDPRVRQLLDSLKENIETVQDSARRAVEAADNVVHAYDMNMGVPETPITPMDAAFPEVNFFLKEGRPAIPITGESLPFAQYRGIKRKRGDVLAWSGQVRVARSARRRVRSLISEGHTARAGCPARPNGTHETVDELCSRRPAGTRWADESIMSPMFASEQSTAPGLRYTNLREVVQYVINDALKVGGRPDSAVAEETELGEKIEVHTRSSNGESHLKMIEWSVSADVPDTIVIDEKDLAKMISCLALNAIKFTEHGSINLKASLSTNARYIVINVKDTGSGIPAAFLPNLFKPFSREDVSTTRASEGLGLGLMVAKGLARKLGGDLFCLRSHVAGPERGSEFEMRVPMMPGEVCSRPGSTFGSPTPSGRSHLSVDMDTQSPNTKHHPTTPPPILELSRPLSRASNSSAHLSPSLAARHLGLPSPRSASPAPPRAPSKPRTTHRPTHDRKLATTLPLTFLVVDDNRINRNVLRHMLKKLGYTAIHEAYDGNDAVQQMRANALRPAHEHINVVLMDLWMPRLDGFQATEKILEIEGGEKKPVVLAVSADVTDAAVERAGKVGMKGFLTKPFVIRDVERAVVQYCGGGGRSGV
ncbi:sensor protein rcsC [Bimuria novae-zelandiae CBS 107.79]|uniref:histidine kinase n=1 Tax=Bimuria novae-zelandiae CBS 107.79 TaxID=1447943 RepID=A0A6A5UPM9_9PLEO|nr:sensor protein rcsC [Bimuria novae-zelandiae CBS 107.79]